MDTVLLNLEPIIGTVYVKIFRTKIKNVHLKVFR